MDALYSTLASKGTVILAIIVVIIGFFFKRIVETIWPQLRAVANEMDHKPMYSCKAALWWNQIVLYALPVVIGGLLGLINSPLLFGDLKAARDRILYAAVVGWFSDFLYEVFQKTVQKSTGVSLPGPADATVASIHPPVNPGNPPPAA